MKLDERYERRSLSDYIAIIENFLNGVSPVTEFEARYLAAYSWDSESRSSDEYEVLNDLFIDVDAFCADPELRDAADLDETALRASARFALSRLVVISGTAAGIRAIP